MKTTNYYIFLISFFLAGTISIKGQTWPLNSNNELSSAFGPRNLGDVEYEETPDYGEDPYDYDSHGGWAALYNS
ncbi:MAG: hypothetical protein IIB95_01095 [Candidatus Marinimicrobia bacterium]|nr:hypothetical protein [Candidatus Neomarinimicrobiota bacterium]MCH7762321.1 hypothetical protein [Candidatus Neomarinimicrobiota bacterium]